LIGGSIAAEVGWMGWTGGLVIVFSRGARSDAGFQVFKNVGIQDGRGDFVGSTGPLAQIDLAAAVAAEGEIFVSSGDDGLASGATENDGLCLGAHW